MSRRPASKPASARGAAGATSQAPADGYTARHLSVLEGLEAVRKRPGMYIGSTDGRGLQHCLSEIIDNAVDEARGGFCTGIEVTLHADGSAEVRDNGRGIPVDVERKTRLSGIELVMTRLQAGGKFGMRTMDTAIQQLLEQRQSSGKEAYKKALNKAKFEELKDAG